jgi:hypothetical protein
MSSWSVPVEIAEMAEIDEQTETWFLADSKGFFEIKTGAARQD